MKKELFEYQNYKLYILDRIKSSSAEGRGAKLRIATFLGCHPAFVSQVLNNQVNFSLEQGVKLNQYFSHSKEESQFFLLLLQLERAGSQELRDFFEQEISLCLERRGDLKNRIKNTKTLRPIDQQTYYSSWHYAAIHILLTIKEFQRPDLIAEKFNLKREKVIEVLDFLEAKGLAKKVGDHYEVGVNRIHLSKDSPLIQRHHTNWRLRAIESLDGNLDSDLHFSTVVSMSKKDVPVVKEIFIKAIEDARRVIYDSKEEKLQSICLDFFNI